MSGICDFLLLLLLFIWPKKNIVLVYVHFNTVIQGCWKDFSNTGFNFFLITYLFHIYLMHLFIHN